MQDVSPDYLNKEIKYLAPLFDEINPEAFILDILNTTSEYINLLNKHSEKIVSFDNIYESRKNIKLVINSLWHSEEDKNLSNVYVGHKYLLIRAQVIKNTIKVKPNVENVLLTFGGADTANITLYILNELNRFFTKYKFHVLIGAANTERDKIEKYAKEKNIKTYCDVQDVQNIMDIADVCLTSGGITLYELISKGIPCIVIRQHENELKYSTLPTNSYLDLGVFKEGIDFITPFKELCDNPSSRIKMHELAVGAISKKNVTDLIKLIKRAISND
jgi:spore coat polysaccharide biosynthesis predicted glycosyltransferase SpsG